ncbi:MAG: AAA family ATPase [candidate division Zixibacteria bacterium]|nr:AAA family ATPase [candidate division Zixibacteria bacterium]
MHPDIKAIQEKISRESAFVEKLNQEISKVIIGQKYLIERLLIGLLANGHILIEGVPGLAKTLAVKTLSQALKAKFQRIQFTPDLLPADLIGTVIYNPAKGTFTPRKGPIFANIILADEINRSPAKVQSALLEAMQERQVTVGDTTYPLEEPFLVLATQNPIEQEGTYPLPEAQVDRFMLKLSVTYPSRSEELQIMDQNASVGLPQVNDIISIKEILKARTLIQEVYLDPKLKEYIVNVVCATRQPDQYGLKLKSLIAFGASPRATIYLSLAAKALAFLRGRGYVIPEDIKAVGLDVLRHRVIVSYEAEAEELASENIIQKIFEGIEVP